MKLTYIFDEGLDVYHVIKHFVTKYHVAVAGCNECIDLVLLVAGYYPGLLHSASHYAHAAANLNSRYSKYAKVASVHYVGTIIALQTRYARVSVWLC